MSWDDDMSEPSEARRSLHDPERMAMLAELYAELVTLPMRQLRARYLDRLHARHLRMRDEVRP